MLALEVDTQLDHICESTKIYDPSGLKSTLADIYTLIFCAQVSRDLLSHHVAVSKEWWIVAWGLVSGGSSRGDW